ncbi:MAG: filamentous hemagglutinin N-terminal domain-containing protein, partial [Gammaproteobacteria bacterium]|nr:filamentous hemagglutinin N-terminal domain-containing protein [Gammaproteobacteria bacterium]
SAILNRIIDQNPSKILGNLTSNGQVFLINPNGIVFGKTARVNVAGIVASSLDITTKDFMAGKYTFTKNITSKSAEVINKGLIKASSSGVILIGSNVINEGKIYAKLGNVALVSANKVSVDFDGDGLIQFEIDKNLIEKDRLVKRNVSNTGEIISAGGHVILNAQTSKEIFTQVVNNDGIIKASRIENHGGDVYLSGGSQSDIVNTGIIDVAGGDIENVAGNIILQGGNIKSSGLLIADGVKNNGGKILLQAKQQVQLSGSLSTKGLGQSSKGGYVEVTGKNVLIKEKAYIDASGNSGGGEILLGGNFQGKGEVQTAEKTEISKDVEIKADAVMDGDGGKVIVWSDKKTSFKGKVSAKGGQNSGDGGFVEVSGKKQLKFEGTVDTSAEQGSSGLLLLDPEFITVAANNGSSTLVKGSSAWDDDTISFEEALDESITITKKQLEDIDSNVILQAAVGIEFEEFELNMQHDLTLETRNSISQLDHTKLPDKIHGIDVSNAAINVDNGMFIISSGQNTDGDNDASTTIKLGKIDAKNLEVSSANTIIIQDDIVADGDVVINSDMDATIVSSGIVLDKLVSDASVKLTSINGDVLLNGQVNGQDKNGLVVDAQSGTVSIDEMSAINDLTIKSNSLSLDNDLVITGNIDFSAANGITLNADTVLESTSGSIDLSQGLNGLSQTLQLNSINEIVLGASQLKALTV